jgi:hypothetical protein
MLRHGNWDSVHDDTVWDPGISDQSLPPSYYLTSKPQFFGSLQWPPIGPDVNDLVNTIPAKVRYEGGTVEMNNELDELPNNFKLLQNYPNPFSAKGGALSAGRSGASGGNPTTTIEYQIISVERMATSANTNNNIAGQSSNWPASAAEGSYTVTLKIYDILGKEIAQLVDEKQSPGNYEVRWDASGNPSGIYFYRLTSGNFSITKKMILIN